MMTLYIPPKTWYGLFIPTEYPDRSGGKNPRYGQKNPLEDYYVNGRIQDLIIGDVVELVWVSNYHHGATMQITKINQKTVLATEQEGSYNPGRNWRLHKDSSFRIALSFMSDKRLAELALKWNAL